MTNNLAQSKRVSSRAHKMLEDLTQIISQQKDEVGIGQYTKRYSKTNLHSMPSLSKAIVEKTVSDMEKEGYVFERKGDSNFYSITSDDVIKIYEKRGEKKYRDKYQDPYVIMISNLKGGVSKTVSTVTLAHALRTHDHLLKEDLRILVIDLDPQSSATMFLRSDNAIGSVDNTATQAMLQNIDEEELINDYIISSNIKNVDLLPSSIDDAFIASDWGMICEEHLPNTHPSKVLSENLISKLKGHYDFIFVDSGPHLDALLENSIVAADLLMTPIPPATVDLHSTLKYLNRLPDLAQSLAERGSSVKFSRNVGFMTKIQSKTDHEQSKSIAKEIFGSELLDADLPRIDAFERCGESFDTVISATGMVYQGSEKTLQKAKESAYRFALSVFNKIQNIRDGVY
ncbi:ParA family protein (plasmid) [Saccharobesus litoralis]|uniref:ParA family protein n=1 Tax=Saccharobesus litoralis TaxID=2172099 RepID=A0A2S0VYC3_9ALTE|nr:AAA family ATPase [Saccharobesus litoralis]AWB69172.1 ParA family protein [Saccharobesus litoralis]